MKQLNLKLKPLKKMVKDNKQVAQANTALSSIQKELGDSQGIGFTLLPKTIDFEEEIQIDLQFDNKSVGPFDPINLNINSNLTHQAGNRHLRQAAPIVEQKDILYMEWSELTEYLPSFIKDMKDRLYNDNDYFKETNAEFRDIGFHLTKLSDGNIKLHSLYNDYEQLTGLVQQLQRLLLQGKLI